MTTEPEKLDLRSHDIAGEKRDELLRLFPEIRTEGGKVDFERLRLALGESVDVGKERYGMTWPGKADCFKAIQTPSMGTLLPCPDESVNWDATENLIIEGDNLEVLKLLQKSYLGKVKMIYIDPPYNTGKDFIYPDNYAESLQTYLEYTGQVDDEGKKFNTNSDTDGRFHSKWLNMMYPRLYLAKNLLAENGVIFISIDDTELMDLRRICDEVFGEHNFLACVVWQKVYSPANDKKGIDAMHDYVVCYSRGETSINLLPRTDKQDRAYTNPDSDLRGPWKAVDTTRGEHRDYAFFPITTPSGREVFPAQGRSWAFTKEELPGLLADNRLWFGKDGASKPSKKLFLTEVKAGLVPTTWWTHEDAGHNDEAKKELKALMPEGLPYDTPKPVRLIRRMLQLATDPGGDAIVLDFFAGSGTTGQAVLALNESDGGNRRFILVQLPEPTGRDDYATIAEITKERVRRAIKELLDESKGRLNLHGADPSDRGFRVFKLTDSNLTPWESEVPQDADALAQQLEMHIDHVRDDRKPLDVLFEVLLKNGFPLTAEIETLTLAGQELFSVAAGALLICLASDLTLETIRAMAELGPERITCLDESFAKNDQLKANAVQIFKSKGIVFRTV